MRIVALFEGVVINFSLVAIGIDVGKNFEKAKLRKIFESSVMTDEQFNRKMKKLK